MKLSKFVWAIFCVAVLVLVAFVGVPQSYAGPIPDTRVEVATQAAAPLTWNLANDFRPMPNQANPNPDRHGNAKVWYFMDSGSLQRDPALYKRVTHYEPAILGIKGLQGWVGDYVDTGNGSRAPQFFKNTSKVPLLEKLIPPGAFVVHPTPTTDAVVGWKSPITGFVEISGGAHSISVSCGGGINWFIDKKNVNLAHGIVPRSASQAFADGIGGNKLASVQVSKGDFVYFAVDPGDDWYCDQTILDVTIR